MLRRDFLKTISIALAACSMPLIRFKNKNICYVCLISNDGEKMTDWVYFEPEEVLDGVQNKTLILFPKETERTWTADSVCVSKNKKDINIIPLNSKLVISKGITARFDVGNLKFVI